MKRGNLKLVLLEILLFTLILVGGVLLFTSDGNLTGAVIGTQETVEVSLKNIVPEIVYEFNDVKLKINIENLKNSSYDITTVKINTTLLLITSAEEISGWDLSTSSNQIIWNNGSISNGKDQKFTFDATVSELSVDEIESIVVETINTNGDSHSHFINIGLLADNLTPRYGLISPQDFSIIRPQDVVFNISVVEEESGLDSTRIFYNGFDSLAISNDTLQKNLTCSLDHCSTIINNREGSGNNYFGYFYELIDKAGNKNPANWFYFYVDGLVPFLSINSFDSINLNQDDYQFNYDLTDDSLVIDELFNSSVQCDVYLTNDSEQQILFSKLHQTNAVKETMRLNFSTVADGNYRWQLNCTDNVGRSTVSSIRNLTIDRQEPIVEITYPPNTMGYDINNTNTDGTSDFNFTIVDQNLDTCKLFVNNVSKTAVSESLSDFDFNETPQNQPYGWYVWCNDSAGNIGQSRISYLYYDNLQPNITELSSNVTQTSATIFWKTDEETQSSLFYGTDENLSSILPAEGTAYSFQINISNLSSATHYYYLVQSCDQFGNCQNTSIIFFTTASQSLGSPGSSDGGGGGGGDDSGAVQPIEEETVCTAEWSCDAWKECLGGVQERSCQEINCGSGTKTEERECNFKESEGLEANLPVGEIPPENEDQEMIPTGAATRQTGDIIKDSLPFTLASIFSLGLIGLAVWKRKFVFGNLHKLVFYHRIKKSRKKRSKKH